MLQSGELGPRIAQKRRRCDHDTAIRPHPAYLFSATSLNAPTSGFSSFPFIPQRMS